VKARPADRCSSTTTSTEARHRTSDAELAQRLPSPVRGGGPLQGQAGDRWASTAQVGRHRGAGTQSAEAARVEGKPRLDPHARATRRKIVCRSSSSRRTGRVRRRPSPTPRAVSMQRRRGSAQHREAPEPARDSRTPGSRGEKASPRESALSFPIRRSPHRSPAT